MQLLKAGLIAALSWMSATAVGAQPAQADLAGGVARPSPPVFRVDALDPTIDPCNDFYAYACGGWLKAHPLPADESNFDRFDELDRYNLQILKGLLEAAASPTAERSMDQRQVGDFYAACMDETGIEAQGMRPIEADLKRIAKLKRVRDLPGLLGHLHLQGVPVLFELNALQDYKDATRVIAALDQGRLGLPEREYYLKDDPESVKLRDAYRQHVARTLELIGEKPAVALRSSDAILKLETGLAKVSLDMVARRNPENLYHPMSRADLAQLSPGFDWNAYLEAVEAPAFDRINVMVPGFHQGLDALLREVPADTWRTYLRWRVVSAASMRLSSVFVNESFSFYGRTLSGAQELQPRWKRCVRTTDWSLGELLGKPYVGITFGEEGKQRMLELVGALRRSLDRDLSELPWMTAKTREEARTKLTAMGHKLGYPDKWRDYSTVNVVRTELVGNTQRAHRFEFKRQLAKIGQPVNRNEWYMSPPTVNAYYDPQMNDINFPAGILQPPFFDRNMDDAVNYGAIGSVIGHELTHGFDDEGRRFDGDGNLRDWWTREDGLEFEQRAQCFVDQYGGYSAVGGLKLNGKLTLGENTADNGGLRIAHAALLESLHARPATRIDGFTPEQRFFLGFGQIWCQSASDEAIRLRTQTDPHALNQYRVNGTVSNMPEFKQAFQCKDTAAMVRPKACKVW